MNKNIENREEWLYTLKDSLKEYTAAPPKRGWESISIAMIKRRRERRTLRVISAISAVAAVALVFLFLPIDNTQISVGNSIAVVDETHLENSSHAHNEPHNKPINKFYNQLSNDSNTSSTNEVQASLHNTTQISSHNKIHDDSYNEPQSEPQKESHTELDIESQREINGENENKLTMEEYLALDSTEGSKKRDKRSRLKNLLAVQFGNGSTSGVNPSSLFQKNINSNIAYDQSQTFSSIAPQTQTSTNIEKQSSYGSVYSLPLYEMPEPELVAGIKGITREYKHKQPITFSVMVGKEFSKRFTLESGLSYTLLNSDLYIVESSQTFKQQLHYIGLPLKFNYNFISKPKYLVYVGAGGVLEKSIYSKLGNLRLDINTLDVALTLGAGAQYSFSNRFGIYLEPSMIYYLGMGNSSILAVTNSNIVIKSVRSEYPLGFALNGGFRFSF